MSGALWALDRNTFRHIIASTSYNVLQETISALKQVELLQALSENQIEWLADAVTVENFKAGETIISKGEQGDIFYIIKKGKVECTVGADAAHTVVVPILQGDHFGERALLTDEPRAATVTATVATTCLALNRATFNELLGPLKDLLNESFSLKVLSGVPLLKKLSRLELSRLAAVVQSRSYAEGENIIEQGSVGRAMYLVQSGKVSVMIKFPGSSKGTEVAKFEAGGYFGEMALLRDTQAATRTADVNACPGGAECLILDRDVFEEYLGPLRDVLEQRAQERDDENHVLQDENAAKVPGSPGTPGSRTGSDDGSDASIDGRNRSASSGSMHSGGAGGGMNDDVPEVKMLTQEECLELEDVKLLGIGSFGRVTLVKHKETEATYAMKRMSKKVLVDTEQQRNVLNERNAMARLDHPFIIKLFGTHSDTNSIYMLLELVLGGELFTLLGAQKDRILPSSNGSTLRQR